MSKLLKRGLSLLMALCMILAMVPAAAQIAANAADGEGATYYFNPGSIHENNERYAVYMWNDNGNTWIDMTDSDGDGIYEFVLPAGYSNIILCRMNGGAAGNDWGNKWDQTQDFTAPTDGKNCFVASGKSGGVIQGEWKTYSAPVLKDVYVDVSAAGWTNVNVYFWGAGSAQWPGKAMEKVSGNIWKARVDAGITGIIFNNGNEQTADLTPFENGGDLYVLTTNSGQWTGTWGTYGYTITFEDEDGTELQSGIVKPGVVPTAPADPTKAADGCKAYTFAGWTPEIVAAAGDATYTATYTESDNHSYVDGKCTACGAADPNAVKPGYSLVTKVENITGGGKFVLVAKDGSTYKALGTTISGKITAVDVTVNGNEVTGNNLPVWTIEADSKGVALSVNGSYLAYNSGTNFKSATSAYAWTVTASGDGFVFNSAATSRGIYYQIVGGRFGAYATSNANVSGYISKLLVFKYTESGSGEVTPHEHKYTAVVTPPTCKEGGYTTYTCACGDSYVDNKTEATGHNYVNGVCSSCGDRVADYSGRYYIATIRSSGTYWYMTNSLGTGSTKRYQAFDTELTTLPKEITAPEADNIFVLEKNADGTYSIYAEGVEADAKYLGWTSGNSGTLVTKDEARKLTVDYKTGVYNIHFTDDVQRYLALNGTSGNNYFAWYKSGQRQDLTLIPVTGEAVETYTITFKDEDGNVLQSGKVPYGTMPTAPADPTKAGDIVYSYTFSGWTPEIVAVTGDATYTATYTKTVNTYYVRGTMNDWGTNNPMTWNGSVYTLTLELKADKYEYKVSNGDWSANWPVDNITINVPFDCKVTFTFDPATQSVTTDLPVMVALAGDFNNWNTANYMTNNGDGTYTMKLELAGDSYEFKIIEDGTWMGNSGTIENATLPSGWEMSNGEQSNCTLKASGGYYTFIYNIETNMLVVEWECYTYTVTWVDEKGTVIDTEVVKAGEDATKTPVVPAKGGHTGSWDKSATNITSDTIITAVYTANKYTLTIRYHGTETKYELDYGATLPEIATDSIVTEEGKYTFWYWADMDAENISRVDELPETMPARDLNFDAIFTYVGWVVYDGERAFQSASGLLLDGWNCINDSNEVVTDGSGSWYYFDPNTYWAVTGINRVPYPTETINGITYGPNAEDLANGDKYGYTDATSSLFVFGEDGKFDQTTGAIYKEGSSVVLHYAIDGQLPYHIGMVLVGSHVYYFIGENVKATGDVYVSRHVNIPGAVLGGIYTFDEDGILCRYDGITKMANGTLRYYDDGQLMIGAGLVKVEDNYIYVRSNGELVVDAQYYVPGNDLGIAPGTYTFDENGFMVDPISTGKNGVYFENGAWYYYENGKIGYNKGLISACVNWYDADGNFVWGEGGIVYVRSNGQLATGSYYATNLENYNQIVDVNVGDKLEFNEYGLMLNYKSGIVDGYYYENNAIAYGAGLIEIDGSYYYVRSNGQMVVGRSYWITNTNGLKDAGCYEFDADGKMVVSDKNGIVAENGVMYYYVDGIKQIGNGLVKLEDGSYIYVRSNGQLATGKYWTTNHNGVLTEGMYDFGENGILTIG